MFHSIFLVVMRLIIYFYDLPLKGNSLNKRRYNITPALQTSHFYVKKPFINYGAIYINVPTSPESVFLCLCILVAVPKSINLISNYLL
jgi:hypothetical protein